MTITNNARIMVPTDEFVTPVNQPSRMLRCSRVAWESSSMWTETAWFTPMRTFRTCVFAAAINLKFNFWPAATPAESDGARREADPH